MGKISPLSGHKHFESDWANKKENMSNIQIPSKDLGFYHQKALYNWFFMNKKNILKKKMAEKVAATGNWTPISWVTGQGPNH